MKSLFSSSNHNKTQQNCQFHLHILSGRIELFSLQSTERIEFANSLNRFLKTTEHEYLCDIFVYFSAPSCIVCWYDSRICECRQFAPIDPRSISTCNSTYFSNFTQPLDLTQTIAHFIKLWHLPCLVWGAVRHANSIVYIETHIPTPGAYFFLRPPFKDLFNRSFQSRQFVRLSLSSVCCILTPTLSTRP